jgi:hypothetical protein
MRECGYYERERERESVCVCVSKGKSLRATSDLENGTDDQNTKRIYAINGQNQLSTEGRGKGKKKRRGERREGRNEESKAARVTED